MKKVIKNLKKIDFDDPEERLEHGDYDAVITETTI